MRTKSALLVSCSVILLCMCIIVGMSYALFSDSVSVKNHLQAGTLDITLTRTNLVYNVLGDDGFLSETEVTDDINFTDGISENVFGIDSKDIRIVPGSYFDADMEISNNGNVAFSYSVKIKLAEESNSLAEQLRVTVTHPDNTTTTKLLSELTGTGLDIAVGEMTAQDSSQKFSVRVDFVNLNSEINNSAQSETTSFDLIVTAVQKTSSN